MMIISCQRRRIGLKKGMNEIIMTQKPSVFSSLSKALFIPRKGYHSGQDWPKISGKMDQVLVSPEEYQSFCKVCQMDVSPSVNLIYPHVLASSLQLALLMDKRFPLKLLGAVHLKNWIRQLQDIKTGDILDIKAYLTENRVTSKGIEFDFETQIYKDDQLVGRV